MRVRPSNIFKTTNPGGLEDKKLGARGKPSPGGNSFSRGKLTANAIADSTPKITPIRCEICAKDGNHTTSECFRVTTIRKENQ